MKNFIVILLSIIFAGCFAGESVSSSNSKQKCDYYINDIIELINVKQFENITAAGTVCDVNNNKSYVPVKNGLPHGKERLKYIIMIIKHYLWKEIIKMAN